jgi:hypothetical protein
MNLVLPCLTIGIIVLLVFVQPGSKNKPIHLPPPLAIHDTMQFASQIQPILVKHCSPCHFPGGKMYEKLPFDKAETILILNDRLLKRIKDEKENSMITVFINENKKQ